MIPAHIKTTQRTQHVSAETFYVRRLVPAFPVSLASAGKRMLSLPGIAEILPAMLIPRQKTDSENAWRAGSFHTIRLVESLPAIRVHAGVGSSAAKNPKFVLGAGTFGRWFAIGDVILTRREYADAHALPGRFTMLDEYLLPLGTELNVGIAAPLFGRSGGALQAERLAGPNPKPQPVKGFWANRYGNA